MSDVAATLKLLLLGEDKGAAKAVRDVGDALDDTAKKGSGFKDAMLGLGGAAIAGGVVAFGKASVESARDAEASQRKLEDAYGRFPQVADVNIDKMRELNEAIQAKTGADGDDMAAAQANLAQYGLTGKQISELTPLMVDYATKTGKDMPEASAALGKALLGSGKAMKELGIDFEDAGSVGGNFEQLMTGLSDKVGGFAESEAQSLDGQLKILKTSFGDVQEEVGGMLLPVLTDLVSKGGEVIKWALENKDVLGPLIAIVGGLAAVVGTVIGVTQAWTAVQTALNLVLSMNPIGLVVLAIAALAAGLIYAYQHSEEFRRVVDGAFRAVGAAGTWLWENALRPALGFILDGFAAVVRGIANMLDALGRVPGFEWARTAAASLHEMADGAGRAKDALYRLGDKTVTVTTRYVSIYEVYGGSDAPMRGGGPREIIGFASGGRPNVGELAMFGEEGPELWVPDRPGTVINAARTAEALSGPSRLALGGGSGGDVYISVQGDTDPLGAARRIQQELLRLKRTQGGVGLGLA